HRLLVTFSASGGTRDEQTVPSVAEQVREKLRPYVLDHLENVPAPPSITRARETAADRILQALGARRIDSGDRLAGRGGEKVTVSVERWLGDYGAEQADRADQVTARFPWLSKINPRRGEGGGFIQNCVSATRITQLMLNA